jgi:hypothetical protein
LLTKMLEDIFKHSCLSIKLRGLSELLAITQDSPEIQSLRNKVLTDCKVRDILSQQKPDGWITDGFHGYGGMEASFRLLSEMGLSKADAAMKRAIDVLVTDSDRIYLGLAKVGRTLDEFGLGGGLMIKASLLAQAGIESASDVQSQIQVALDGFRTVTRVTSLNEVYEPYRGKLVFRAGVNWPSIYHLRLLAYSQSWRNSENRDMLVSAIRKLVAFSPIQQIYLKHKSQLIAPASFCMHNFLPAMHSMNDANWMMWFHRMELLARLGVVQYVPQLMSQVRNLKKMIIEGSGKYTKLLRHDYFRRWGAYSGMMLEKDWKNGERRTSDLTFRSYLILHKSDMLEIA